MARNNYNVTKQCFSLQISWFWDIYTNGNNLKPQFLNFGKQRSGAAGKSYFEKDSTGL